MALIFTASFWLLSGSEEGERGVKAERPVRSWFTVSLARHHGKSDQACFYLRAFALAVLWI